MRYINWHYLLTYVVMDKVAETSDIAKTSLWWTMYAPALKRRLSRWSQTCASSVAWRWAVVQPASTWALFQFIGTSASAAASAAPNASRLNDAALRLRLYCRSESRILHSSPWNIHHHSDEHSPAPQPALFMLPITCRFVPPNRNRLQVA